MHRATRSNKNYILSRSYIEPKKKEQVNYGVLKQNFNKRVFEYLIMKDCFLGGFSPFNYRIQNFSIDDKENNISIPKEINYTEIIQGLMDIGEQFSLNSVVTSRANIPEWKLSFYKNTNHIWSGRIFSYECCLLSVCFLMDQVLYGKNKMCIVNSCGGINLKKKFKNCALDLYLTSQLKRGLLDVHGIYNDHCPTNTAIFMKHRFMRSYEYMKLGLIPVHGCMETLGKFTIATTFETLPSFMNKEQLDRYKGNTCHLTLKKIDEMEKLVIRNKTHTPIILSKNMHVYEFCAFIEYLNSMNPYSKVMCPILREFLD